MRCFRHEHCGQTAGFVWQVGNVFYVACKACVLVLQGKSSAQPTGK